MVRMVVAAAAAVMTCGWPMLSHAAGAAATDAGADVEAGRALFMQKGCYECHGIFGQGSIATGPALAPHPIPLEAMQAYVHNPKGQMPVFSEKILPNEDLGDIHAYLASIPKSKDPKTIPLLSQ